MPIEMNIHTRIVVDGGLDDVAEIKKQLFNLFGGSPESNRVTTIAGQGVAALIPTPANDTREEPQILGNEGSLSAAEADAMAPKRTRRTKAQIAADEAAQAALLAANTPSAAAVQLAEAVKQEAAEIAQGGADAPDDFDLLGGGDESEPPKPAAAAIARVITKDEMMAAGRAVMDKPNGFDTLGSILKAHGFAKIGVIPESAYPAVMADLEEAVT